MINFRGKTNPILQVPSNKNVNEQPGFVIDYIVTHKCNMHCPHCVDEYVNQSEDIVKLKDADNFFKKIKAEVSDRYKEQHGITPKIEILLVGGEPTMAGSEYLNNLADLAHKYGFEILISTNGIRKDIIKQIMPKFDWIQLTCRTDKEIDYWRPYKDKVNVKFPGDENLTYEKYMHFAEYTKDFKRRSLPMYFTPDYEETCKDKKMWDYLDSLEWKRSGHYIYAYTDEGIRVKRSVHGASNIAIDPLSPKIHPNGNYNVTWKNDKMDENLMQSLFENLEEQYVFSDESTAN